MANSFEDWWGLMVFVFFIIAIAFFIIKILIEYPGLLEIKFFKSYSTENLLETVEDEDIELGDIKSKKYRRINKVNKSSICEDDESEDIDNNEDDDKDERPLLNRKC